MSSLVLVVEPDAKVRAQAVRAVRAAGFDTRDVASLAAARALPPAPFVAMVIADQLPDGTAAEFVHELKVPAIVLATTPRSDLATRAVLAGARAAISRQGAAEALGDALKMATAHREAASGGFGPDVTPTPRPVPHPDVIEELPRTAPGPAASSAEREVCRALREELKYLRSISYYRVLGVGDEATEPDILVAFAQFASKWHPDKMAPAASAEMRALAGEVYDLGKTAYDTLINPVRRGRYLPPPASWPPRTAPLVAAGPGALPQPAPQSPPQKPADSDAADEVVQIVDTLDDAAPSEPSGAFDIDLFEEDPRLVQTRTLVRSGDHAAARKLLTEILRADALNAPARALVHVVAAAKAHAEGHPDQATQEIEHALAADGTCPEALELRAQLEEARAKKRRSLLDRVLGRA